MYIASNNALCLNSGVKIFTTGFHISLLHKFTESYVPKQFMSLDKQTTLLVANTLLFNAELNGFCLVFV